MNISSKSLLYYFLTEYGNWVSYRSWERNFCTMMKCMAWGLFKVSCMAVSISFGLFCLTTFFFLLYLGLRYGQHPLSDFVWPMIWMDLAYIGLLIPGDIIESQGILKGLFLVGGTGVAVFLTVIPTIIHLGIYVGLVVGISFFIIGVLTTSAGLLVGVLGNPTFSLKKAIRTSGFAQLLSALYARVVEKTCVQVQVDYNPDINQSWWKFERKRK